MSEAGQPPPPAVSQARAGWTHLEDGRWSEAEASFQAHVQVLSDSGTPNYVVVLGPLDEPYVR